jgi:type I restriction enzyme R subunit
MSTNSLNFAFLAAHDPSLDEVAREAEKLLWVDAAACVGKLRLLAELLARELSAVSRTATYTGSDQHQRLKLLAADGILPTDIARRFHAIRTLGNDAIHGNRKLTLHDADTALIAAWHVAVWFHRTLKRGAFAPPAFQKPPHPDAPHREALKELNATKEALEALQRTHASTLAERGGTEGQLATARRELDEALAKMSSLGEEAAVWQSLAADYEARHNSMLETLRREQSASPVPLDTLKENAAAAAAKIELTEAEVRRRVDEDIRRAGWNADTGALRWSLGARPAKGVRQAIAEVPAGGGFADYVLFDGTRAVAVIEAKAAHKKVVSALDQASGYARELSARFVFATNGRDYFPQLREQSGIWFADLRGGATRPLAGWYSPEGLARLDGFELGAATRRLADDPFPPALGLRDYQRDAIRAVEGALAQDARRALLAMATGTGKTRTCLGLIYRLIKSQRVRRVLFVVDREFLATQAAETFQKAKLDAQKAFADIYALEGADAVTPRDETRVHITTVQGLIRRILFASTPDEVPPVEQYDCVIVDECHRGYALDRHMSDDDLTFRDERDYQSKYRRALEHFDAVCIGLTATPAIHTVTIFGRPVYEYRFRQAVLDGWLVDQEPVIAIKTQLGIDGIHFEPGESVERYSPLTRDIDLAVLEDAVDYSLEEFNRRVISPSFNQVVCEELVRHIDPAAPGKTLVFCVSDDHATAITLYLREALRAQRGVTDPGVVEKITGRAHKPRELFRRYRNEALPSIAVTVDLLTTGVDVEAIDTLVFLRGVKSRILYEQMLGRATRLCAKTAKRSFRVFDAAGVTEQLEPFSAMRPTVVNPKFSFADLVRQLDDAKTPAALAVVQNDLLAKLRYKLARLPEESLAKLATSQGLDVDSLAATLASQSPEESAAWWRAHASAVAWLDEVKIPPPGVILSPHEDRVLSVEQSPGGMRPDDYLDAFEAFLRDEINRVPALQVVLQRPRDLTRAALKEVRAALDAGGYREAEVRAAWRLQSNADIAAGIIGFIRQRALGSPLVAYELRVDRAAERVLASRAWSSEQRRWIERIAKQLKQETVVDRDALDQGAFATFGGARKADAVFEGHVGDLLGDLHEEIWRDSG